MRLAPFKARNTAPKRLFATDIPIGVPKTAEMSGENVPSTMQKN
jgi:hypothetical protein